MLLNVASIRCIKIESFPRKIHSTFSTKTCTTVQVLQVIHNLQIIQTIYRHEDILHIDLDCNCCNRCGKM